MAADTSESAPRRALLVDDEPVIRHALRRFFQRQGWNVDDAENGGQALALLLTDGGPQYDVIISDLRMPDISGMDLYERLAVERPALLQRLILSTGDSVSPEASEFLRRSACPVLNKPVELAELRAMVGRMVVPAS